MNRSIVEAEVVVSGRELQNVAMVWEIEMVNGMMKQRMLSWSIENFNTSLFGQWSVDCSDSSSGSMVKCLSSHRNRMCN